MVTVIDLDEENQSMPLQIVNVGTLTQGEIPEALLIRVLRPAREGGPSTGNVPVKLHGTTPPFTATVFVEPPGAAQPITRPATILDPSTLADAYPQDFAAPEEGWVRVDFADGDFDELSPPTPGTQVQLVFDDGVVRLKTRDVWAYEVADGPAAAVSA